MFSEVGLLVACLRLIRAVVKICSAYQSVTTGDYLGAAICLIGVLWSSRRVLINVWGYLSLNALRLLAVYRQWINRSETRRDDQEQ